MFANLIVSKVIKDAGIVRAGDVGTVNARESIIADAKVVLTDTASRAIFRAGRGEILPQITQLFVAILLTVVVWSLDPKVWMSRVPRPAQVAFALFAGFDEYSV